MGRGPSRAASWSTAALLAVTAAALLIAGLVTGVPLVVLVGVGTVLLTVLTLLLSG